MNSLIPELNLYRALGRWRCEFSFPLGSRRRWKTLECVKMSYNGTVMMTVLPCDRKWCHVKCHIGDTFDSFHMTRLVIFQCEKHVNRTNPTLDPPNPLLDPPNLVEPPKISVWIHQACLDPTNRNLIAVWMHQNLCVDPPNLCLDRPDPYRSTKLKFKYNKPQCRSTKTSVWIRQIPVWIPQTSVWTHHIIQ